jgi:hypothetical protein
MRKKWLNDGSMEAVVWLDPLENSTPLSLTLWRFDGSNEGCERIVIMAIVIVRLSLGTKGLQVPAVCRSLQRL